MIRSDRGSAGFCLVLALTLAACGAAFERRPDQPPAKPVPRTIAVLVLSDAALLPPPVVVLGELQAGTGDTWGKAEAAFRTRAAAVGCDAVVAMRLQPMGKRKRWIGDCVRSARLEGKELPPGAAEAMAAAAAAGAEAEAHRHAKEPVAPVPPPAATPPDARQAATDAAERARKAREDAAAAERESKRLSAEAERERKLLTAAETAAKEEARRLQAEATTAENARRKAEAVDERERKRAEAEVTAAEKVRQAAQAAAAEEARRQAELTARQAEQTARRMGKQAEREEKERLQREEEATAIDRARLAADAEAAEKARQATADKDAERARQAAAAAELERTKGDRQAAASAAIRDGKAAVLLEFLALHGDTDEATPVHARLQKAAVAESAAWLTLTTPVVAAERVERRPVAPPATLAADLAAASVRTWRRTVPREVKVDYTFKNPTPHPLVADIEVAGQRVPRLVAAGQTATATLALPCLPDAAPVTAVEAGVLEYRHGCLLGAAGLVGLRPVVQDLAADKRAADPDAPLEALARMWLARPGSRMAEVYPLWVEAAMRRRSEDVRAIGGSLKVTGKVVPAVSTDVKVAFRNSSGRDVTVLYNAGTGRDERLLVAKGAAADVSLLVLPGQKAELDVRALMPRLRSPDWLVGTWGLATDPSAPRLVVLPVEGGSFTAFLLTPDAGGMRAAAVPVTVSPLEATFQARLTAGPWLDAVLGAKAPPGCARSCDVTFTAKLSNQDQYLFGGPRFLPLDVAVEGKTTAAKLQAAW